MQDLGGAEGMSRGWGRGILYRRAWFTCSYTLLLKLPPNALGRQGLRAQVPGSLTHTGDPDELPCSWILLGLSWLLQTHRE